MIYHIKYINKNLSHRLNLFYNSNKKLLNLLNGHELCSALSPLGLMSNNTKLRGENDGPKPV